MSTPPVPPADSGAPEHDPTGIRELLSALPDPGPMPADLVARINASIAAEQSARERSATGGATVVPLRRRGWGWQQVGVAAAAVAILAFGLPALLTGTGPGDVMASLSGRGSAADSASSAAGGADSGSEAGAAPGTQPSSSPDQRVRGSVGQVTLVTSGTAYTAAALASQARAVPYSAKDSVAAPKASRGAAESETGLRACLTAIGVQPWMPVRGDLATLDGAPAVVAVVSSDTGQTVYAVSPACDATHPVVLAGPIAVP